MFALVLDTNGWFEGKDNVLINIFGTYKSLTKSDYETKAFKPIFSHRFQSYSWPYLS